MQWVIGTFFAINGVFQLLGVVIIYLPFALRWNIVHSFPSCGFVYYLINVIIALIGIVAYTCVARQYQYRVRDEPDNIYRYAEEYYANARNGPNYDYMMTMITLMCMLSIIIKELTFFPLERIVCIATINNFTRFFSFFEQLVIVSLRFNCNTSL